MIDVQVAPRSPYCTACRPVNAFANRSKNLCASRDVSGQFPNTFSLSQGITFSSVSSLLIFALAGLRLHGGDRDGVDDVLGLATAGEVVRGPVQPLKDGADGRGAGQ